jgi:hypothetical protein
MAGASTVEPKQAGGIKTADSSFLSLHPLFPPFVLTQIADVLARSENRESRAVTEWLKLFVFLFRVSYLSSLMPRAAHACLLPFQAEEEVVQFPSEGFLTTILSICALAFHFQR